ncbi:MAG TPA: biopolymer transporter ExbD [Steroidobacteraceae bacterium]|nr:biopolymer transporter ExbD [Steroidobacteraceae bacterium]
MSMTVGTGGGGEEMCDINTTPLIDVMLVLLIMLILTLPIMTHAVKLDMPNANNPPPPQEQRPEVIDLEIDYDGTVVWNGNTVPSLEQLASYFRTEAMKDPQPEIHLRPDKRVKYDFVAKVLAAAQRNHMKRIGFVNTGEFSGS